MGQLRDSAFENALQELAAGVEVIAPERAILFGSAVSDGLEAEDFDVLVVAEEFAEMLYQNRSTTLDLPTKMPTDLWLYTPAEFETLYPPSHPMRESMESDYIDLLAIHA